MDIKSGDVLLLKQGQNQRACIVLNVQTCFFENGLNSILFIDSKGLKSYWILRVLNSYKKANKLVHISI